MKGRNIDNCAEYLPQIVKVGKEILILSMISKQPMAGYDLIKQIYAETNVFLSQGTVYPILYSFEEAGILRAEQRRGDMNSKIYRMTPPGSEMAKDEGDHFVQALNHFINCACLAPINCSLDVGFVDEGMTTNNLAQIQRQ